MVDTMAMNARLQKLVQGFLFVAAFRPRESIGCSVSDVKACGRWIERRVASR